MPDIAMHHAFGQEVRGLLPEEIQKELKETPFIFALYGPDPWFMYRPGKTRQGRGRRMHTTKTGAFLTALAERAKNGTAGEEIFSYLAGFLCHYALDSIAHPYIIWQTTETWPTKRAHRDMEHALDAKLLMREGFWQEQHSVTEHHFPLLRLPESMEKDLNAVYREIYGWEQARVSLNRCYKRYRMLYRVMEKPRSFTDILASLIPTHRFRSVSYPKSAFLDLDVENLTHNAWHQAFAPDMTSTDSFPELYAKAREEAVRMIADAWDYARKETVSEEALKASLGNRSYLSGLDADDPRNRLVPNLMPPD